jgi:hypothetical protein
MIGWPNGLKKVYQVRPSFAGPERGQVAQQERAAADHGEHRQAAGVSYSKGVLFFGLRIGLIARQAQASQPV